MSRLPERSTYPQRSAPRWAHQHDRVARDGLGAADRADVLAGLGLDVHGRSVEPEQSRDVFADRRLVRDELRCLRMDGHVAVDRRPTGPRDLRDDLGEEPAAVEALPLRVRVGIVLADIAQGRPAARRASATAWSTTSASEWPSGPRGWSIRMPPRIRGRPATSRCVSCPKPTRTIGPRSENATFASGSIAGPAATEGPILILNPPIYHPRSRRYPRFPFAGAPRVDLGSFYNTYQHSVHYSAKIGLDLKKLRSESNGLALL